MPANVIQGVSIKNKGFTLMEVVIAVSLTAIVSVVSVTIVSNLLRSALKSQSAIDVEQTANFILPKLKGDIEKAYKVEQITDGLRIYQTGSGPTVVAYEVFTDGSCNPDITGISCLKRNSTLLTDSSSDPVEVTKPSKSSVSVDKVGTTEYFNVINDVSGNSIAVNVSMKLFKPGVSSPGTTSSETIVNATIVLPSQ